MIEPGSYLDRVFVDFSLRREDELAAIVTHIVGFGLNTIMAALLIVFAAVKSDSVLSIISFSVFSLCFTLYYIFSVLYHALYKVKMKKIFRVLELNSKYLLFFGAGMPLTLIVVGGRLGLLFFGILSLLIICGMLVASLHKKKTASKLTIINTIISLTWIIFFVLSWQAISNVIIIWIAISIILLFIGIFFDNLGGFRFHHAASHLAFLLINMSLFFGFLLGFILV